jgi:hypothetical protein
MSVASCRPLNRYPITYQDVAGKLGHKTQMRATHIEAYASQTAGDVTMIQSDAVKSELQARPLQGVLRMIGSPFWGFAASYHHVSLPARNSRVNGWIE